MSGGFVSGRKFVSESEYLAAVEDLKIVEKLKSQTDMSDPESVSKLYAYLQSGEVKFNSVIGRDFDDEIYELMQRIKRKEASKQDTNSNKKSRKNIKTSATVKTNTIDRQSILKTNKSASKTSSKTTSTNSKSNIDIEHQAALLIEKANKRRRLLVILCAFVAIGSLSYFIIYSKVAYSSQKAYDELAALKGTKPIVEEIEQKPLFTLAEDEEMPEILDEYKNIYLKNKNIVGWLTIDGTNIDYPVMQTVNNDYYLKHDLDGKDDNNGALFMDYQCNVMFRSTNLIIYGHHMKSGKMFGNLKKYKNEDYCKQHSTIKFDTIFKKGTYEVMYVFQDEIKDAADVSFKYYQFIDAVSEEEFNSNMNAMKEMSFFDTGVTASYGDEILTLSTCDGSTSTARFVVVAKKVK